MDENIIESLRETNRISNLILANHIERYSKMRLIGSKEYRFNLKNQERAYNLFLKLIDKDSSSRLRELDTISRSITRKIYEESGWWETPNGFMYQDNFQNMDDHEFRSFDTYRIYRNDDGYYCESGETFNNYFAYIRSVEEFFFDRYKDILQKLHETKLEKEEIMTGSYSVIDDKNTKLCNDISSYLGFKKKQERKEIKK